MKVTPIQTTRKPKPPLKSITQEKQDCIRAFKKYPKADYCWCCHHEKLIEGLRDDWMERIRFIRRTKPVEEQAIRFRNFRPFICKNWKDQWPERMKATKTLLNRQWPGNTWNGESIF